jgi:hypothetical protein
MFTPDYEGTLVYYDQREQEIQRALESFAGRTDREGRRVYRLLLREYGREMAQINERRRILAPFVKGTKPGQKQDGLEGKTTVKVGQSEGESAVDLHQNHAKAIPDHEKPRGTEHRVTHRVTPPARKSQKKPT